MHHAILWKKRIGDSTSTGTHTDALREEMQWENSNYHQEEKIA
ncbi:hypothetical protein KSF_083760 [Reticulibacter mediterranei]|uniref:Uncharacterized protein n=1 Tax=Reticulibacter mediterranei TaxID=2778369 RepID=A0A8J3IQF8_9CHLR|nr:hypothetical protein KSF_083760 [Reticulibacter mediterranei]